EVVVVDGELDLGDGEPAAPAKPGGGHDQHRRHLQPELQDVLDALRRATELHRSGCRRYHGPAAGQLRDLVYGGRGHGEVSLPVPGVTGPRSFRSSPSSSE